MAFTIVALKAGTEIAVGSARKMMEDKPVGQPMNFGDAAFFQQELHNQGISSIIVSDETLGKSNEAIHRLLVDEQNLTEAEKIYLQIEHSTDVSEKKEKQNTPWSTRAFFAALLALLMAKRLGSIMIYLTAGFVIYLLVLLL